MRVKSCVASDGAGHVIKLSDEFGCVLRPKMISRFLKARAPDDKASVITYAFFHAFKFPDALSVHIKCKVEICRHGCLDHCQTTGVPGNLGNSLASESNGHEGLLDRKDTLVGPSEHEDQDNALNDREDEDGHNQNGDHDIFYDDIVHKVNDAYNPNTIKKKNLPPPHQHSDMDDIESLFLKNPQPEKMKKPPMMPPHKSPMPGPPPHLPHPLHPGQMLRQPGPPPPPHHHDDKFPHGPRQLQYAINRAGLPMAGPRSLNLDEMESHTVYRKRTKRSIHITDRKARSADVGVSGLYDVISEADLAFSPDTKQEAVTVFQGKIPEEVVYGICMPVPGFSILFILVISATIVAALVAGSLLYRYQLQKDALAQQQVTSPHANTNTIANWMTMRLFRMRHGHPDESNAPPSEPSSRQMESRQ